MADGSGLSPAKVVLLAVQLASKADITTLRYLVASHPKTLQRNHLILRILLTFLPETVESSAYIPLLHDITSATLQKPPKSTTYPPLDQDISDEDARKRVRKLHLIHLVPPTGTQIEPDVDPFVLFLLQRAYRVDSEAGLLPQILALLVPFLDRSEYLRTWTIVTLLPLLRFTYEYYPEDACTRTLHSMDSLDNANGVQFLLSKAEATGNNGYELVGRDLKGLVGPWMYGDSQTKRGKNKMATEMAAQTILPLENSRSKDTINLKWPGWEQVFKWIMSQSGSSWPLAVDAIEQWDGPGDVELGAHHGGDGLLEEEDQRLLEIRYAQTALATAYLIREDSLEAQTGIYRILTRTVSLLDYERIPTLPASASLLLSIPLTAESGIMRPENAKYLHSCLLEERNILTNPTQQATSLLYALTISAYLLTRAGSPCSVKKAGELALLQNEKEQMTEMQRFVNTANQVSKSDDKYWIRIRNEILWLRDWGLEPLAPSETTKDSSTEYGHGIFGRIERECLEVEILKALLSNDRFTLARSIYETSAEKPLPVEQVAKVVMEKSRRAFDNATNGNKTRGGVKKSLEILQAFPGTLKDSVPRNRQTILVDVADQLAKYRVVIKHGQPFTPADISAHRDPLALIGILLDQNPSTYTQLTHMRKLGEMMVKSGLTVHDTQGLKNFSPQQEEEEKKLSEKRIISMCVDAALAVDDFETAYSYVMNNLVTPGSGLLMYRDDWSWRASLQAGKYRRNPSTTKPTHLGNASANPEIRHLEQRMDCLSQALRIAPKTTLVEILNNFRRCEEELATQTRLEEEAEAAWDAQADQQAGMSGFSQASAAKGAEEETPISLFDLGRRSAENAKRSLASIRASQARNERMMTSESSSSAAGGFSDTSNGSLGTPEQKARKRDQLRNAAVGTLASGIGWLINAPPVTSEVKEQDED